MAAYHKAMLWAHWENLSLPISEVVLPRRSHMATVVTNTPSQEFVHPAFLDGQPKRMLINGQWVEAASGKTF